MNWLTRPLLRFDLTPARIGLFLLAAGLASALLYREVDKALTRPVDCCRLYRDIVKLSVTDLLYETDPKVRQTRWIGGDWPGRGLSMIGIPRLVNLEKAIDDVIDRQVPGDLIEAGAWRGGATIVMRAALKSRGVTDRIVWVADSFEGLPPPNPDAYPADAGYDITGNPELAASLESVQDGFKRYGLLDDQVRFLKGWFKDTLKDAPIEKLAILRVDADLYESTTDALTSLYPKLSPGGYVIIDDYGDLPPCRKAVDDYRAKLGISTPLTQIDWTGVYWVKEGR